MKSLKLLFLSVLVKIPFIGKALFQKHLNNERRLYERFALKKLANIAFKVTYMNSQEKIFYLKDISLGGLSFYLDANDQESFFKSTGSIKASLAFEGLSVAGTFRVAWVRNGLVGCQLMTHKNEYKKFVMEKMADILVNDETITG